VDALAAAAAVEAATLLRARLAVAEHAHVMFASGDSQLGFLDSLARIEGVDWSRVVGFHMDEYLGIGSDSTVSFARYMRERVVEPLGVGTFHYLHGDAPDPAVECEQYAALLDAHHLDLCCLGIGENGHLAFNDPPVADFEDPSAVKVVRLDEACKAQQVGEGHFATVADVPPDALTVTIPALLSATHLVVIVPDARKASPVRAALEGPVEPACPASVLQRSGHATIYLDPDSAALLHRTPGP
jgi:glucosamine-6-phosphate deaminase